MKTLDILARIPDSTPHFMEGRALVFSSKNKIYRIDSLENPKPRLLAAVPWSAAEQISRWRLADRCFKNSILQVFKFSDAVFLATTGRKWWRIEDGRAEEIEHFPGTRPMNRGICRSSAGMLYVAQYTQNPSRAEVSVFRTKDLRTFETAWTFPAGSIRHIHALIPDPERPARIWVLTGDLDAESAIYFTENEFSSLECFLKAGQLSRATDLVRMGNTLYWGMDSPDDASFMVRSSADKAAPEKIFPLPGPVYYMGRNEAGALYAGTTVEKGRAVKDRVGRIWGTSPDGAWQEIASGRKDWVPQHGLYYFPRGVMPGSFLIFSQRALVPHEGCMTIARDLRWEK